MKFPDFALPWLFLLLIPAAGAAWIMLKKKKPYIRFPELNIVKAVGKASGGLRLKLLIPFLLVCLSAALIVIALARPREGLEEIRRRSDGVDIIIALDVSGSMGAIDIPKGTESKGQLDQGMASGRIAPRLDVAKREIAKFVNARPSDRIGLIVFAQQPYMVCPPTLDHGWLLANLENLHPGIIGDKTGIAGPVASAARRLKDSDSKRRIVVLFTDGANNITAKVSPRQAAKLAKTFDITVYTVGIGSENSIFPQETPFGKQYVPIRNDFDEPLLQEMAELTGGKYDRADDTESMAAAMKAIDALEKTTFEQQTLINWRELSFPLIAVALGAMLLAFLLENTVFLKVP